MSTHRRNTLVVDFSVLPKRPVLDQVEEFLKSKLKLDMADVKCIQLHHIENCVFIEMNNASVAPRLHKLLHLQHSFIYQGVDYYVPVYVDGPTTTVKIHDLPPQMSNTLITNHLQQYGKVLSIHNDVWKNYFSGVPNGVRVVRMRIEKPVPAYIIVDNQRSYVSYPKDVSQQRTSSSAAAKSSQHQTARSSGKAQNTNDNNDCEPPSTHIDSSGDDDDDDDDSDDGNNSSNRHEDGIETLAEPTGKRRLSTEAPNGTRNENEPKRSCKQDSQKAEKTNDSEWKVYQTRSRKKNGSEVI